MEQKHIDEVEEDSFGEEFVDEDYPVLKVDKKKSTASATTFKPKSASVKKKEVAFDEEDFDDEEEIQIKPARVEPKIAPRNEPRFEPKVEPKKEGISITPAFSSDPDKNNENGGDDDMFKKVSTWTVISVVLLILLVISIFSGGFGYGSSSVAGEKVSMDAAEEKVLNYVNTNLLAPPFVAEVKDKAELDNLYKFTLSVAGQEVESYVTLDGKLFFPRGFELNETTIAPIVEEAATADVNVSNITVSKPATVDTTKPAATEPVETEPIVAEPSEVSPTDEEEIAAPVESTTPVKQLVQTVTAKKWLFDPNVVTVKKGQSLKLTIKPVEMGEFTFSVSGLGVEQKVVGDTIVEFTPDKVGTYKFLCSTCEDWRGMTGNLVVE
jgi:plastocyanin